MTRTDGCLVDLLEAEDALETGSGPMALVLAVAACCVGDDAYRASRLPEDNGRPVLYLAAHDRAPLAPLAQLLRLAGAEPLALGDAGGCAVSVLQGALRDLGAAALVFRSVPGTPSLPDAAGAVACLDAGARLVVLEAAAGKGAVAGEAALVAACRLHRRYLGRLAPGLD